MPGPASGESHPPQNCCGTYRRTTESPLPQDVRNHGCMHQAGGEKPRSACSSQLRGIAPAKMQESPVESPPRVCFHSALADPLFSCRLMQAQFFRFPGPFIVARAKARHPVPRINCNRSSPRRIPVSTVSAGSPIQSPRWPPKNQRRLTTNYPTPEQPRLGRILTSSRRKLHSPECNLHPSNNAGCWNWDAVTEPIY